MKLLKTIKHDYLEMLPPAIFFFISFMLILITKRLILSEYGISWSGLGAACAGAILVAKVVLIVDKLPFVNRFADRQLIYAASWKCLIYLIAANLVQYMEHIIPLLLKHKGLLEAHQLFMSETVWPHFWLMQIWLTVLFFIYCALRELVRVIGRDKVMQMFFSGPNSADSH
jgi:hypothetical protein